MRLTTWSFTLCRIILRGGRGTYGAQLGLVTRLVAVDAASFCVAGVALRDIDVYFVWQAWHLTPWTFTLCGTRGTYGTQLGLVTRLVAVDAASFCVANVALGDIDLHFVWQASHLTAWSFTLCGRRGTYGTQLGLVTRLVAALHLTTWTFTLCGRRGTYGTQLGLVTVAVDAASFCVAGVALGDIDLYFVWQAWHLTTWSLRTCGTQLGLVTRLVAVDAASFCVAGVALGDTDLYFVWQAWHLTTWTLTLCGSQLGLVTRLVAVDAASFCVADVALGDIDFYFLWQGWRLTAWTFTLCGRRGTYGTQLGLVTRLVAVDAASFCVAGVALGDIDLYFVWQARGTYGTRLGLVTRLVAADAASFCMAGVALGDIDFYFVWQAWHLTTWTFTLCGTRGTYGTQLGLVTRLVAVEAASFCVAGVALGDTDFPSVWQAWHLTTWTFTSWGWRGKCGTQLGLVTRLVANLVNERDQEPLFLAAQEGHFDLVRRLLEAEANINAAHEAGDTALHVATAAGHLDIVRHLVKRCAKKDRPNYEGETPLLVACRERHEPLVRYLVENRCSTNQSCRPGITPLWIAGAAGDLEIVRCVVEVRAAVDHESWNGVTPLTVAANNFHWHVTEYLFSIRCARPISGKRQYR
eukprot:s178_g44.t1